MAEDDDEVDTRDIYTDDESDEETNAVELSDIIDEVDEQDYHTERVLWKYLKRKQSKFRKLTTTK